MTFLVLCFLHGVGLLNFWKRKAWIQEGSWMDNGCWNTKAEVALGIGSFLDTVPTFV
jgi:hypothetical protein